MNNDQELMRKKVDAIREYSGPAEPSFLLDYLLHDRGMDVSIDDLPLIIDGLDISDIPLCPKFISDFIASYLSHIKPPPYKAILDPWAGIGSLLTPIVQRFQPDQAIGLCLDEYDRDAAAMLSIGASIDWRFDDNPIKHWTEIGDSGTKFNVIVSYIPHTWALTVPEETDDEDLATLPNQSFLSQLIVQWFTPKCLESDGIGFFIISPSSAPTRDGEQEVYTEGFTKKGLSLDAVLSLPIGAIQSDNMTPGLLFVIRREKPENLFVGELTPDSSDELLKNLKGRKAGKVPQLGALVDSKSFTSFRKVVAEWEIRDLACRTGLPPVALSKISIQTNLAKRGQEEEFTEQLNSVYLPLIGRSAAVTSLDNMRIEPQNYAQIVLDPGKAISGYVANFLNTSLGQKIRESLCSGSTIPKITKSRLENPDTNLYLPDLNTQAEVLYTQSTITDLSTQLKTLQDELWSQPRKAAVVAGALKTLNRDDGFMVWIESLPFPLASILWAYDADNNDEHKVDHLFHFFEALSEFTATVMLSIFSRDEAFYNRESEAWISNDPRYKDWIFTSSFGGWNTLAERLAKTTRRLMNDDRDGCLELYSTSSEDSIAMLIDKKLFSVLREAGGYRNLWMGHSGVAGPKDIRERLGVLEAALSKVQQVISDKYATAKLISPGSNEYSEGIYEYEVKLLQGTRTPFQEIRVNTLSVMDKKKLYLLHADQLHPVELLPFFRIMESPSTQQNACYFYNRLMGDDVRWVSYHFEDEAEIIRPDDDVMSAISLLRPRDSAQE